MKRFRGGLVFEAHGLAYHTTLGWRVIKKKKKKGSGSGSKTGGLGGGGKVYDCGSRVRGLEWVWGMGFIVEGWGFLVEGVSCRVEGVKWVQGCRWRVLTSASVWLTACFHSMFVSKSRRICTTNPGNQLAVSSF